MFFCFAEKKSYHVLTKFLICAKIVLVKLKVGVRSFFMSDIVINTTKLLEMLPEKDQHFAYEFVKKLILAWDSDFTKVTPFEAERIRKTEESGFISESEINWDKVGIDV
jgi:hypothetical protein